MATDTAGTLVLSDYIANRRFEYGDLGWFPSDEEETYGKELGDFERVAIAWAEAFDRFKVVKEQYEAEVAKWTEQIRQRGRRPPGEDVRQAQSNLSKARREMIYKYGRIHEADLYAHFSPISLIQDSNALSDWGGTNTPGDSVGIKGSVWKRILAVKGKKFYKVYYSKKPKEMGLHRNVKKKKHMLKEMGKKNLVPTNIVETDHITKIINEHVLNPDPKSIWERIKEWRYKRDWW